MPSTLARCSSKHPAKTAGAERSFGLVEQSQGLGGSVRMAKHIPHRTTPENLAGKEKAEPFSLLSRGERTSVDWDATLPRAGIEFQTLRSLAPMSAVLELLAWTPVSRNGPQLRGPCPIHQSSSEKRRSFSVNVEMQAFQCFGCGRKGNQLDLFAAVTGLPLLEAAWTLAEHLAIDRTRIEKRKP